MTPRSFSLVCCLALLLPLPVGGTPVLVNFDALNATGGPITGPALDTYLAGFGITLSNIVGPAGPSVYDATTNVFVAPNYFGPPTMPNFIWQPTTNNPIGYQMDFATSLTSISITRTAMQATIGGSGLVAAPWSARAIDALGNTLATAGEPLTSYFVNVPAQTFTLSKPVGGADIAALVIERTSVNVSAGLNAAPLDDFLLTPVPEPGGLLFVGGAALAGTAVIGRRRGQGRPIAAEPSDPFDRALVAGYTRRESFGG